jgi:hypothetical protein
VASVGEWSRKFILLFPLWLVWGNGLGNSFFLAIIVSSGQVEWSTSSGSHSFEVHSCEQFQRMVRYRRLVRDNHFHRKCFGQSFPRAEFFSPGCTVINVGAMA